MPSYLLLRRAELLCPNADSVPRTNSGRKSQQAPLAGQMSTPARKGWCRDIEQSTISRMPVRLMSAYEVALYYTRCLG